jgi:hypothetical protein
MVTKRRFTALDVKTEVAMYERSNARPYRGQFSNAMQVVQLQPLTRSAARCCRAR